MKIKLRYELNKKASIKEKLICPSCQKSFIKEYYQQAFCRNKSKTKCKDKYWNTVTPEKRVNTTRISPASASYMAFHAITISRNNFDINDIHQYEDDNCHVERCRFCKSYDCFCSYNNLENCD